MPYQVKKHKEESEKAAAEQVPYSTNTPIGMVLHDGKDV